jgi:two-component system, LytTR family, response regulator
VKVLIVDDEPIARQVLREYLEDMPGMEIAGEAVDGHQAAEMIQQNTPDVVLLDLQMPGLGGLAVARNLMPGRRPLVIFVTAFEKHALEAFETGAVGYLLKPVRQEKLATALDKARRLLAGMAPAAAGPAKKIIGRLGSDIHLLETADVIAFHAEGDLVFVLTSGGKYYAEHSLKALEARLDPQRFRRIHRKTIVNTEHIRRISPLSSKRWLLKMSSGLELVVSRRMAGIIREQAHW